ncbi:MAG: HIT domain-containing protein [Candidatus Babeliaceae bacterium]|jgi:histidine triad (HIT) family protein
MNDCVFCAIIERQIPSEIVSENNDIIVIKDRAPKAPIHYLIIPKKHIKDIQSFAPQECCYGSKMMRMAQTLSSEIAGASEFKFLINNGHNAGQRVFHLHAHFLAGTLFTD